MCLLENQITLLLSVYAHRVDEKVNKQNVSSKIFLNIIDQVQQGVL